LAISASFPTPLNNLSNSRIDFSFLSNTCFSVLKAANHAEEMHHNCIKNQQNFIFKEERIKIRTLKGGHTVPAEKIKSRYSDPLDPATTINTGLFFRILSCLRGFL
jgi:hypothetical protein